jgi:hypothetical protein
MEESMSRASRVALALLLTCASVSPASAEVFTFSGVPSGSQESPPTSSPGTGLVTVTFDDVSHLMSYNVVFSDLVAGTTAAHIHVRPDLMMPNGGVATEVPFFTGFPIGVTEGVFINAFDMTLASSYNPAFLNNAVNMGSTATAEASLLSALFEGRAYFNIHTTEFPSGEIRADLNEVPEPATWMMLLGGFGAIGLAFRRRRRREPVPA